MMFWMKVKLLQDWGKEQKNGFGPRIYHSIVIPQIHE